MLKVTHPGRTAGAAPVTDDALHRFQVTEPPLLETVLQIDQLFRQLVQFPMPIRLLIDRCPGLQDAVIRLIGVGPVALQNCVGDLETVPFQGFEGDVIQAWSFQRGQQMRMNGGRFDEGRQHGAPLVPHQEFDLPVLRGLETGTAAQIVTEGQVVGRCHGRQHRPGLDQLRLNPRHPRQHLEGRAEGVFFQRSHRRAGFMDDQLHPQLSGLMDDDEQHLVMGVGNRLLRRQQVGQAQVTSIAQTVAEIGMRAFRQRFAGFRFVVHVTTPKGSL